MSPVYQVPSDGVQSAGTATAEVSSYKKKSWGKQYYRPYAFPSLPLLFLRFTAVYSDL